MTPEILSGVVPVLVAGGIRTPRACSMPVFLLSALFVAPVLAGLVPVAEADRIVEMPGLPTGRYATTAVWRGGTAYVFGGTDSWGASQINQVVVYDAASRRVGSSVDAFPAGLSDAAAVVNPNDAGVSNVYLFGGRKAGAPTDDILRFNTNSWSATRVSALPSPRLGAAAAWSGGAAYVFGGEGAPRDIVRYVPGGSTTTLPVQLPSPTFQAGVAEVDGAVFLFGGWDGSRLSDRIVRFLPATGEIAELPSRLPSPRRLAAAVYDGSDVYVLGGEGSPSEVVRFDPATGAIALVGSWLPPTTSASSVWTGREALLFGGTDGSSMFDRIVSVRPSENAFETVTVKLPRGSISGSAVSTGAAAYVFGGQGDVVPRSSAITRYSPGPNATTVLPGTLPVGLSHTSAAWTGAAAYVFGGFDGSALRSEIVRFDPATETARVVASLPSPRASTSAAWDGAHAYVFGGDGGGSQIVRFHPDSGTSMVLSSTLPSPRRLTSAAFDGQHVYVFGGGRTAPPWGTLDEIVRFDPSDGSVVVMSARLPAKAEATSAVWDGRHVYVFAAGPSQHEIVRYDPASDTVLTMGASAQAYASSAVALDGRLYLFGGGSGDHVRRYDLVPGAPRNVAAASGPGASEILVSWAPPAGNTYSGEIERYVIHRADGADGPFAAIASPSALSYVDVGVPAGTTRWYRVAAVSGAGEGEPSLVVSAMALTTPGSPRDLTATTTASNGTLLRWSPPVDTGGAPILAYSVYRARDGGPGHLAVRLGNVLTWNDRHCDLGATCTYTVHAENFLGSGPDSNEASAPGTAVDGDSDGVPHVLEAALCSRAIVASLVNATRPHLGHSCRTASDYEPGSTLGPADADADGLPDAAEPVLCAVEDRSTPADGSCDPTGRNYTRPGGP